jgi:hypothetical protein
VQLTPTISKVIADKQHDGDSCGVYCVALAFDFMSGSMFFQRNKTVRKSAIYQLRLRMLWRILCDSNRIRDDVNAEKAAEVLNRFTNTYRETPRRRQKK